MLLLQLSLHSSSDVKWTCSNGIAHIRLEKHFMTVAMSVTNDHLNESIALSIFCNVEIH